MFLIPFVVFFFGTPILVASDFEYEILYFLKKHLPRKYFYNAGFSYAIEKGLIKLNIKTITINGKEISTKDKSIHIKELFEMVENGTEIYLDGNGMYKFCEHLHLLISKKTLIEYLVKKHGENRLIDCEWNIKLACKSVYIKNNLIPNEGLRFFSNKDTSNLLKRISRIQKETILNCILNKKSTKLSELTNDDYYYNYFDICMYGRDWQPIEFGTTFTQTEPSNVQEEQISISTDTPIGQLVQEIDKNLEQGYVFKNITEERWENIYRKECEHILTSKYGISMEQETELLEVLQSLKDNMYDSKEKQHYMETDINIKTMKNLLKMDGIESNFKM